MSLVGSAEQEPLRNKPAFSMGFLRLGPLAPLPPALRLQTLLLRPVLPAWRMHGSGLYPVLVAEALMSPQLLAATSLTHMVRV